MSLARRLKSPEMKGNQNAIHKTAQQYSSPYKHQSDIKTTFFGVQNS